jgi:hypothetical protein
MPGSCSNEVIVLLRVRGTFAAPFGDIKPTGRNLSTEGVTIVTFNEELKIVREHVIFDGALVVKKLQGTADEPQF